MVKEKIENETKEDKFKRIATYRTNKILDDLRLLGNCSNVGSYYYTDTEVNKIFNAIETETKRIKYMFNKVKNKKFEL